MARDATTRQPRDRRDRRDQHRKKEALAPAAAATPEPTEAASAPAAELEPQDDLLRVVEAMLFAAHESLSSKRIARAIGYISEARIDEALGALTRRYDAQGSPLMLAEIAGGWRLVTRPEYAPFLARLFSRAERERLSQAALETLAIVAYRQPATRAEVEAVRGVLVGPLLRVLQERRLIKIVGRAEIVGRPLQYGTTKRFLDHFGLASIADLPKVFPMGRPGPTPAEERAEAPSAEAPPAEPPAAEPPADSGPDTAARPVTMTVVTDERGRGPESDGGPEPSALAASA